MASKRTGEDKLTVANPGIELTDEAIAALARLLLNLTTDLHVDAEKLRASEQRGKCLEESPPMKNARGLAGRTGQTESHSDGA